MFPTRGLLQHVSCPDQGATAGGCSRLNCPFKHESLRPAARPTDPEKRKVSDIDEQASHPAKSLKVGERVKSGPSVRDRTTHGQSSQAANMASRATQQQAAGVRTMTAQDKPSVNAFGSVTGNVARNSLSRSTSGDSQKAHQASRSSAQSNAVSSSVVPAASASSSSAADALKAPLIVRSAHPSASSVPLSVRQMSVRTYFVTFSTLYAPLHIASSASSSKVPVGSVDEIVKGLVHRLASEDALASEANVFKTSNTNATTYRNSVRTTLVGITRRKKEDKEAFERGEWCLGKMGVDLRQRAIELLKRTEGGSDFSQPLAHDLRNNVADELCATARASELVGTPEDVHKKRKILEERAVGSLTIERIEKRGLLADEQVLRTTEYPLPSLTSLSDREASNGSQRAQTSSSTGDDVQKSINEEWGQGGIQHTMEGEEVSCERCGVRFIVKVLEENSAERQACCYHWGKRRFLTEGNRTRGPRTPRWSCCDALDEEAPGPSISQIANDAGMLDASLKPASFVSGSAGCTRGPHVFKEEKADDLHRREGFMSTEAVMLSERDSGQDTAPRPTFEVLAFDCELVYTTAGMSLARLTVLEESGRVVLDEFIQPRGAIVDYNTRFSGIQATDIPMRPPTSKGSIYTLQEAREALVRLMKPNTILVGHGLENDLKAVRLVHRRIVDSVFLYPHRKGLPFRMSLRELARIHLGKYIQADNDARGHDAEEDARAALELIRLHYLASKDKVGTQSSATATTNSAPPDRRLSQSSSAVSSVGSVTPIGGPPAQPKTQTPVRPSASAASSLFLPRPRKR